MLGTAHHDAEPVPYLPGSGDLGLHLYRLIVELEKLGKKASGVQLCSCVSGGRRDNPDTLDSARTDLMAAAYADLCGVLAACGQADALALVQGFRPPRPE